MTYEMKHPMPPEDQAELDHMKQWPNKDGTIGWMLTDSPQAVDWYEYYRARRPHKAAALLKALSEGKQYMVAAQHPQWFDRTWHPVGQPRDRLLQPKVEKYLSAEEREIVIDRVLKRYRGTASGNE